MKFWLTTKSRQTNPSGQVLFITGGQGYCQVKGEHARPVYQVDVVEIPPKVILRHGAGPGSEIAHIAISLYTAEGGSAWSGPLTAEEYTGLGQ